MEPPRSDETFSASSPSSSSPASTTAPYGERDLEAQRDRNHSLDDDLENQLADLRDSFDDRADELRRRTNRFRAAIDLKERIRDQPLVAVAIGAAAGAAVALVRPMGRVSTGIIALLVGRTARYIAIEMAARAYRELMNPQDSREELRDDDVAHSRGYGAGGDLASTNGLRGHGP